MSYGSGQRRTRARPNDQDLPKFKFQNNRARIITRRPQVSAHGTKGTLVWAQPLYSTTQQRPPKARDDFPQESVCKLSASPQKAKPKASRKRLILLHLLINTEANPQGSPDTLRPKRTSHRYYGRYAYNKTNEKTTRDIQAWRQNIEAKTGQTLSKPRPKFFRPCDKRSFGQHCASGKHLQHRSELLIASWGKKWVIFCRKSKRP